MNIKQLFFGGNIHLIPICPQCKKNILSASFYNNLNICFVHIFPMELKYTILFIT